MDRNRRDFLKSAGFAAAPLFVPRSAWGANDKPAYGIIGTGGRGRFVSRSFQKQGAECVAVCDVYEPHLEAARKDAPDAKPYVDYHDLLALPDVDMVEILLPHYLHHQATLDAAAAGKHISLQKPIAINLAEADEMIAATRRAGVKLKVFENFIFYPPMQRAKALVDAGEIGDPITIRIKTIAGTSPDVWDVPAASWA